MKKLLLLLIMACAFSAKVHAQTYAFGNVQLVTLSASGQITSTVATGTAPFVVSSTTPVANLSIGGNAATATSAGSATNIAFSGITSGTNTTAAMACGSGCTVDIGAASVTAGFKLPTAAGAAPTADGFVAFNATTHAMVSGSNGTTIVGAAAGTGTTGSTTCTNQVFTVISATAAPTCTTITPSFATGNTTGTGNFVLTGTPTITTPVLTGLPTGSGVASAATASTLASRDANANMSADNFIEGYTTTVTAAGTTTLTVDSTFSQYFTGTTTQIVVLPVTSTLVLGQRYYVVNNSTGIVTVNSSGGNLVLTLAANTRAWFTTILTSGTSAASWSSTTFSNGTAVPGFLLTTNAVSLTTAQTSTPAQNATRLESVYVPNSVSSLSDVWYTLTTSDNSANVYDIGLYGPNCLNGATSVPLVVHTGAQAGTVLTPGTGNVHKALTGAPVTTTGLVPGWYCIAMTSSAAAPAAVWGGDTVTIHVAQFANGTSPAGGTGTTSGGALNATITAPAAGLTSTGSVWFVFD